MSYDQQTSLSPRAFPPGQDVESSPRPGSNRVRTPSAQIPTSPAPDATGSPRITLSPADPNAVTDELPEEYIQPDEDNLLPPPNFSPFFTLIDDVESGEHYHPTVYYSFSDDDPELQTAIALRVLDPSSARAPSNLESLDPDGQQQYDRADILPEPRPGVKERFVIIDIAADGQTVADVQSLSEDWQVTHTDIGPAPSFSAEEEGEGGGSLMLRVEGTELRTGDLPREEKLKRARDKATGDLVGAMEDLASSFEKSMSDIGKIAGGGDGPSQAYSRKESAFRMS